MVLLYTIGKTNEETFVNFCREVLGLNLAGALGAAANVGCESNFKTGAIGDSGTSYGICQWHAGRYTNLKNWCAANGLDYTVLDGQLWYMKHELETSYSAVLSYIRSVANTADGAYNAAYADVAVIHTLPGMDFLDRMVSNVGGIALALNSILDTALFGKNINALVPAGLRNLDAGEGKAAKKPGAPMFKVISAHGIDRAEDFVGSRWSGSDRRGAGRRRLCAVLFRVRRGGFYHGRGLDNACMYQDADEHKHDDREQQRAEEVKPGIPLPDCNDMVRQEAQSRRRDNTTGRGHFPQRFSGNTKAPGSCRRCPRE